MRRRLDKEGKVRLIVHRLMSIVFHHHNNHLFLTFMIILVRSLFEEKTPKSLKYLIEESEKFPDSKKFVFLSLF